jgi:preprotein translocase subunit Sec61beta
MTERRGDTGRGRHGEKIAASPRPIVAASLLTCTACGARPRRGNAKFCLICGKLLREDYQPLDRLRASYHLQGKSFGFQTAGSGEVKDLFVQNKNSVSQTAWACLVYSMVPYLGILFIPLTFVIGGVGYATAVRRPQLGGRKLALMSIAVSFVVLAVQLFLWWLLYIVPGLGK